MPMRGLTSRLVMPSSRLLPTRSGSTSVRSSSTRTKPAGSPRGETSAPFGPWVAITQNGDRAMIRRQCPSSARSTLSVARLIGA